MNSGQRPKSSYVRGQSAFAALWSILVLLAGLVVLPIAAHAAFTEIGPSPLGDENGTSYGIRVPDNYNGLLIIDLDYVTARNSARETSPGLFVSTARCRPGLRRRARRVSLIPGYTTVSVQGRSL